MSIHVVDVRGETTVSVQTWKAARYTTIAAPNGYFLHLTAFQAEKLAAELITSVDALRKPSDEDLIRDAMIEAGKHLPLGAAGLIKDCPPEVAPPILR